MATRIAMHTKAVGPQAQPSLPSGVTKADVIADKAPTFRRTDFCSVIRGSRWNG